MNQCIHVAKCRGSMASRGLIVVLPIAIATLPVIQQAWEGISVERKLNIDFLDLMAIAITNF